MATEKNQLLSHFNLPRLLRNRFEAQYTTLRSYK